MATKIAAVQTFSKLGDLRQNIETVERLTREAAANGAKLIVFPECMNSGYVWRDPEHARDCADPIPGALTDEIAKLTAELDVYVAIGISEQGVDERHNHPVVYNAAALVGPSGLIGKYQKNFLFDFDPYWFELGETGYPVFETEIGKVGMFICADARIPEGARALTLKGAEILLHITNSTTHEQHLIHVPTRGNENEVYIVSADKAGREKGLTYPGNSLIISPDGTVQAQGSQFDEEIVYGEVDLATLKAMRERKDGILNGRRPETYGLLAEEYDRLPIAKIIDSPVVPSHLAVLAAVQQVTNVDGDAQATLERALAVGYEAAKENARLIVFPELFLCGLDPSPEEAGRSAALTARAIEGFANHARQWNASYALSLVTEDAGKLHQSVHLVGPDEARSRRYDKVHLSEEEARWATPGTDYVVAEMPFGNVGLMAGHEVRYFEVARILTCMGADVIAAPSCWRAEREKKLFLLERALENKIFIAAANRPDAPAAGGSGIVLPNAAVMSTSEVGQEDYSFGYLNLAWGRDKQIRPGTDLIKNRRTEFYGPIVGSP